MILKVAMVAICVIILVIYVIIFTKVNKNKNYKGLGNPGDAYQLNLTVSGFYTVQAGLSFSWDGQGTSCDLDLWGLTGVNKDPFKNQWIVGAWKGDKYIITSIKPNKPANEYLTSDISLSTNGLCDVWPAPLFCWVSGDPTLNSYYLATQQKCLPTIIQTLNNIVKSGMVLYLTKA